MAKVTLEELYEEVSQLKKEVSQIKEKMEEEDRELSPKFIKEIKESEEEYKRGDFVVVNSKEERRKLFDSL